MNGPYWPLAYPTRKSIQRFRDRVRALTRRCAALKTEGLVKELDPTVRAWGEYHRRAPCPNALPQARWLDCATHLVAPFSAAQVDMRPGDVDHTIMQAAVERLSS